MKSTVVFGSLALGVALVPHLAAAQNVFSLLKLANTFLNALIGLFITLAIVVFFWGIIQYLWGSSGETKSDGLTQALWGVVVIFVMVSIWGIIRLLQSTLGTTSTDPVIPKGIDIRL